MHNDGVINSIEELVLSLGKEPSEYSYENTKTDVMIGNTPGFTGVVIQPFLVDHLTLNFGLANLSYPFRLDDFKSLLKSADRKALEVKRLVRRHKDSWIDYYKGDFEAEIPTPCKDKQTGKYAVIGDYKGKSFIYSRHDDLTEAEIYKVMLETRGMDLQGLRPMSDDEWTKALSELLMKGYKVSIGD